MSASNTFSANYNYDLSIVIISFNTIEMTRNCLRSVFDNLGALSAQIIVVDNNSADQSAQMVKEEFPTVELIENAKNKGFAAANNQAFAITKSGLILLLNSDTLILGNTLQNSVNYMKQHPDVGAFGCRVLNGDKTVQRTCSQFPTHLNLGLMLFGLDRLPFPKFFGKYQFRHWNRDSERDVDVVSGCYLLTRQTVLDTVGMLDEDFFFFGEETEWCKRIYDGGWKVRFAPVGEIIHFGGGSVKSLKSKRDIMLTSALVRFHLKTRGKLSAFSTYVLLFIFNFVRAIFWQIMALFSKHAKERAVLFTEVIMRFADAWPKEISK